MKSKSYIIFIIIVFISLRIFSQNNIIPIRSLLIKSADYDYEISRLKYAYSVKQDKTLGTVFHSMNEIRIGLILNKLKSADSIIFKRLWAAITINKEYSCNCFKQLENIKYIDIAISYNNLRNQEWFKILAFCKYRLDNIFINQNIEFAVTGELNHDFKLLEDNDQKYRESIGILSFILGDSSIEVQKLKVKQSKLDSFNLLEIERVFKLNKGYPSKEKIREEYLYTVPALIIIHSDSYEIQERYLPVLLKACQIEPSLTESVKLLVDKMCVKKYSKQVFGTQYGYWDANLNKKAMYPILNDSIKNEIIKKLNIK